MEKQKVEQQAIYCEDDQHYHRGQKIKYLMVKQDKGSITKRLLCDECYLGNYKAHQQYCCNIQELINGNIYEAFKYTKFDNDQKQQFFNYIRNHNPYLNKEYINNMINSLMEMVTSYIEDLKEFLLQQVPIYMDEIKKWAENVTITNYFECDDLRKKFQDKEFQRSPQKFYELNKSAEDYVIKINSNDDKLKIDLEKTISDQKLFFNLDRFKLSFQDVIESIQTMQQRTFSNYKFSQSILATPYLEKIVEKISPGKEEDFVKDLNRIYRMTQHGSNYQKLQDIHQLNYSDTITIIQTKNKCVFGVYNCISQPQKSILFQMNKEKYFLLYANKKGLQLNLNADLSSWIMNFGEDDIIIQSTFTNCTSNLGQGFDISGTNIFDRQEYLTDCKQFDIYDMEIFEVLNTGKINPIQNFNMNPIQNTSKNLVSQTLPPQVKTQSTPQIISVPFIPPSVKK